MRASVILYSLKFFYALAVPQIPLRQYFVAAHAYDAPNVFGRELAGF